MKIERLYAITVYLLNHGRTSAGKLAEHFEVSVRTIQRDIDSLCLAGIPIVSLHGAAGGYEISDRFRLDKELVTPDDYSYIRTALSGLVSATESRKAKEVLEKIAHMSNSEDNGMILDFSVLREGEQHTLQMLQRAVLKKRTVNFMYTNNNNETRMHSVEPLAVIYRWYAWYLLAYSKVKDDYRMYKLVRMSDLEITDQPFCKEHDSAERILKKNDKTDSRSYTDVVVKCKERAKSRVMEYLKGKVIEELPDGAALLKLTVVENEQLWIGNLLSFGNDVEVLEPERIRRRLAKAASEIVSLYQ